MIYKEALAWLYSLQRFGIKLGLENIRRLIAELDINLGSAHASREMPVRLGLSGASPEISGAPRIIHVAGTNGKGSVCAMIDSICRAQKYRTGLFISPHLVTFRERIRVNGEMISEKEVAALWMGLIVLKAKVKEKGSAVVPPIFTELEERIQPLIDADPERFEDLLREVVGDLDWIH